MFILCGELYLYTSKPNALLKGGGHNRWVKKIYAQNISKPLILKENDTMMARKPDLKRIIALLKGQLHVLYNKSTKKVHTSAKALYLQYCL